MPLYPLGDSSVPLGVMAGAFMSKARCFYQLPSTANRVQQGIPLSLRLSYSPRQFLISSFCYHQPVTYGVVKFKAKGVYYPLLMGSDFLIGT